MSFSLGGAIAIRTYVNADELKLRREEAKLLEIQGEVH